MIQRVIWTFAILVIAATACKSHKKILTPTVVSDELKEVYYEAEAAYQSGNLAEARTLFVDFAKKSPLPAAAYHRLACIERKESHYSEALVLIEKAQIADTGNYYYNLFEAEVQVKIRQYAKAADIYQNLAIKYPSHWSFFSDAAKNYRNGNSTAQLIVLCTYWEKAFGLREEIANYRCEAPKYLA
jgi:tetratricopeptide (TPR) repeat protein